MDIFLTREAPDFSLKCKLKKAIEVSSTQATVSVPNIADAGDMEVSTLNLLKPSQYALSLDNPRWDNTW